MVGIGYPCSIEELEQHFDNALLNLRVYELPLPLALKTSLTVFEDRHTTATHRVTDRLSAEAAMLHHKRSIEILVPSLFRKCKTKESPKGKFTITQDIVDTVTDALDFCER